MGNVATCRHAPSLGVLAVFMFLGACASGFEPEVQGDIQSFTAFNAGTGGTEQDASFGNPVQFSQRATGAALPARDAASAHSPAESENVLGKTVDAGDRTAAVDGGGKDSGQPSQDANDPCGNGVMDGAETDMDCGGPDCAQCPDGASCVSGLDCDNGLCGLGSLCTGPACDDAITNGGESAVDCGGSDCPPCPNGEACSGDADCASGSCSEGGLCQCMPRTSMDCSATDCGSLDDGCGGALACPDQCEAPALCFSDQCCSPRSVESCTPGECGAQDDGCGGTIDCPDVCGSNFECRQGSCKSTCKASACPGCGLLGLQGGCCKSNGTCGCTGGLLGGGSCR